MPRPRTLLALWTTLLLAAACQPATEAPAPTRSWRVAVASIEAGAVMAGALLPAATDAAGAQASGTALLVGGQKDAGAAWLWRDGQLVAQTVPPGQLLTWVSARPDGTALLVGNGKRALWRHADGTYSAETLPDGEELWGCWLAGADEAWAVGGNPLPDNTATPVLLHRTAAGWSQVTLPKLASPHVRLFKVDGHSADDVTVVGDDGEALHWDGKLWQEEATGTGANLTTVRALADGRYIAVGGQATGVVRVRGSAGGWSTLRDVESGLSGVDVFDDKLWVCGAGGWLEEVALDGSSAQGADSLTAADLHLMLRLPSGDALAGGGDFGKFQTQMHGVLLAWQP